MPADASCDFLGCGGVDVLPSFAGVADATGDADAIGVGGATGVAGGVLPVFVFCLFAGVCDTCCGCQLVPLGVDLPLLEGQFFVDQHLANDPNMPTHPCATSPSSLS